MPPETPYPQPAESRPLVLRERDIETALVEKLRDLKYTERLDIRDRASLEANFRQKFEALNRVRLTESEFQRLLEELTIPDVFTAARVLREKNDFTRDDGTPLAYTLVNIKDWCKNDFEVVHQLRINTDYSHHRYDVLLLINGVPVVSKADEDVGAPGDVGASRDVGASSGFDASKVSIPRWYSRGYLPHLDSPQVLQSITYRLADSLPREKLEQLRQELRHLPESSRERAKRERIESWLDAGMGGCALRHPEVASFVQRSFLHFHGERYHLHAWCVMPNHVHVLIEPLCKLALIVQGWKSFTARWIARNRAALELDLAESGPVWMREYWDRYIRDENHYRFVVDYIHRNPVDAGLCNSPQEWPWSSASVTASRRAGVVAALKCRADGDVGAPGDPC